LRKLLGTTGLGMPRCNRCDVTPGLALALSLSCGVAWAALRSEGAFGGARAAPSLSLSVRKGAVSNANSVIANRQRWGSDWRGEGTYPLPSRVTDTRNTQAHVPSLLTTSAASLPPPPTRKTGTNIKTVKDKRSQAKGGTGVPRNTGGKGYSRKETTYGLWAALPLQPGSSERVTKRYDIVPGKIYGFEQVFGTLDVLVNIRMTVLAMKEGGLLVYAPIAATPQCVDMVRKLEEKHGEVKHIILPTTAVEHKVFFGPFAKKFKNADLWVAPGQWSFPLNLPLSALGLFPRKASVLPVDPNKCDAPWKDEFDYRVLKFSLGLAPFVEAAFFHKPTKSLLVTDSVVFAPSEPPKIVQEDPRALLFRSKDNIKDPSPDNMATRRKGWGKTVLFSQFLQPEKVRASLVKDYPALLAWDEGWEASWARVKDRLFVSPVVQVLVFSQAPKTVSSWVEEVCQWPFNKIIPAHFSAPIRAGPREFRRAFQVALTGARGEESVEQAAINKEVKENILDSLFTKLAGYEIGLPSREMKGDFSLLRSFEKTIRATGVVKGPAE